LGRMILVGTRSATIAIVAATDVTEAVKRRSNPWSRFIDLDGNMLAALYDVWRYAREWNGCPIQCWHGFTTGAPSC
jgi:hypothetical protein